MNFSSLAVPLHAFTHTNVDVVSGLSDPLCMALFHSLLRTFSTALVLSHFNFSKP